MHDLASRWNTNYFTIQTAFTSLVREGLVERKPRLGTFVRKQNAELKSVGIYYGDEILLNQERAFHRSLHAQLLMLLQKENISANVFIDCRPIQQLEEPLPELLQAVQSHAIQALIVPLARGGASIWLKKMSVPTSFFDLDKTNHSRVSINNQQILSMACEALNRRGCRTVALIHSGPNSRGAPGKIEPHSVSNAFQDCVKKYELRTQKSWIRVSKKTVEHQESYGYEEFHRLWSEVERPDGLIVYSEAVSRGVVIAALENKVKVPSDLKLVLHRNQSAEFVCPLAADWVITQEQSVAQALIGNIKDRINGLEPNNHEIDQKLFQAQPGQALPASTALS